MLEAFNMAFGSIHDPLVMLYNWLITVIPA